MRKKTAKTARNSPLARCTLILHDGLYPRREKLGKTLGRERVQVRSISEVGRTERAVVEIEQRRTALAGDPFGNASPLRELHRRHGTEERRVHHVAENHDPI